MTPNAITYEDMRPGSYELWSGFEDIDLNHVQAVMSFPNFPRFRGQTFPEENDTDLVRLRVNAYNELMVDGCVAGPAGA